MPESPARAWRESWPPLEMPLTPSGNPQNADGLVVDKENSRGLAEVSPLSFFLAPALPEEEETDYSTDDFDDDRNDDFMDFELDAGIEGASHPAPVIRSVSPSSLDGYGLPRLRPLTPPRLSFSDSCTKHDADEDDVILDFPPGLHNDITAPNPEDEAVESWKQSPPQFCFPTLFMDSFADSPTPAVRTRPSSQHQLHRSAHGSGRQGIMITGRRSPRAWREPSPEVFSIEEETIQQLADGVFLEDGSMGSMGSMGMRSKKHVRFVLPDRDMA